jgi:hypothetical protein
MLVTMLLKRFKYLAILPATAFLLYLSMVGATQEVIADPEVAVQNVFRQILNIRPPNEPSSMTGKVFTPPKHMLELYQKYTAGGGPKRTTGSTVRSILPTKGKSTSCMFVICPRASLLIKLVLLSLKR